MASVGEIGRLQTLDVIPVVAGDSIEYTLGSILRLSALRRHITMDCKVDLFAFFEPYWHIYGDDWYDFIKQGVDETITFPTLTVPGGGLGCLGFSLKKNHVIPKHRVETYVNIYNRYFKDPTKDSDITSAGVLSGNSQVKQYGVECCHMPNLYSTGISPTVDAQDKEVDVSSDKLDILDLAQIKARYKSEQERDWFMKRYNEVMKGVWKSEVSTDTDQRPELLAHSSEWMSGYEVDGTSLDSLGLANGKSISMAKLFFPRKYFNEHGQIWIMALLRFPQINVAEGHYFENDASHFSSYRKSAGDSTIMANEPPVDVKYEDVYFIGNNSVLTRHPFGWHYMTHPNRVHSKYASLGGFPFLYDETADHKITSSDYETMFQTDQLAHWNLQAKTRCVAYRHIPDPRSSIYAGTR